MSDQYPPPNPYGSGSGDGPPPFVGGYAGPPVYGYGGPPPQVLVKTNTNAIVSLISSIITWVLCPVVPAIVGVVTGVMARRQIRDSNGRETGDGLAIAGIIISGLHLALIVAVIVLIVAVAVLGSSSTSRFSVVSSTIR